MSISDSVRQLVRQRANFACEYCGVSETDIGGNLTIDHFQPQSKGGNDELENVIYCCIRCNQYKADYWSETPNDQQLWNPRRQFKGEHFLLLSNGVLHPLTEIGSFTIRRLRLNRPPLVAYRLRQKTEIEKSRLLERYQHLIFLLTQLTEQQLEILKEQQVLLEEQQSLLKLLTQRKTDE